MNIDSLKTKQEIDHAVEVLRTIARGTIELELVEVILRELGKVTRSGHIRKLELLCRPCVCGGIEVGFRVKIDGDRKHCEVECACGRRAWGSTEEFTARKWNEKQ